MDASPLLKSPNLQSLLAVSNSTKTQVLSLLSPDLSDSKSTKAASELQSQLSSLRGQHRKTVQEIRDTKAQTATARAEVDKLHLQLQNLLYEQAHLRSEILACESYDHVHLTLPLLPFPDFLAERPDLADADPHDIMVARIGHEHKAREELEAVRQGLLKKKQSLIADNKRGKEDLDLFEGDLDKIGDATAPAQQRLGL